MQSDLGAYNFPQFTNMRIDPRVIINGGGIGKKERIHQHFENKINHLKYLFGNDKYGHSGYEHTSSGHSGSGGSKGQSAAISALTLLAFLFFLNILQSCIRDQMANNQMTVVVTGAGRKEIESRKGEIGDMLDEDDVIPVKLTVVTTAPKVTMSTPTRYKSKNIVTKRVNYYHFMDEKK